MRYNVELLWRAERDLDHIVTWLFARSPDGAARWLRSWDEVLERLYDHANTCGLAPEDEFHDLEIRHALFKTRRGRWYRVLFTIIESTVYIMSIRGPGQDLVPPDELPSLA